MLNTEVVQYSENTARDRSKPRITPQPIPKIELISCCPVGSDSDIKLNRTDTTIDLSHGGREGMNRSSLFPLIYFPLSINHNGFILLFFSYFFLIHKRIISFITPLSLRCRHPSLAHCYTLFFFSDLPTFPQHNSSLLSLHYF